MSPHSVGTYGSVGMAWGQDCLINILDNSVTPVQNENAGHGLYVSWPQIT